LRKLIAALLPLALIPLAAACGSSTATTSNKPAATPSIAPQTAEQKVLNYQACSKDGKQKLSTVLPKAANAPDLKIEQTHVVGEIPGNVRVGIIYDYNGGTAKHQVIFDYNPDKNTLAGEDTISQNAIKQLQAACK
jgi:hypothetical protein